MLPPLIMHCELFTMSNPLIMRLIVPQVHRRPLGMDDVQGRSHHHHPRCRMPAPPPPIAIAIAIATTTGCWSTSADVAPCSSLPIYLFFFPLWLPAVLHFSRVWCDRVVSSVCYYKWFTASSNTPRAVCSWPGQEISIIERMRPARAALLSRGAPKRELFRFQ